MDEKNAIEVVVYYDSRFPSSWISEKAKYPQKIAKFLQNKSFKIVNANELRKFMIKSLENDDAYKKLVIFA